MFGFILAAIIAATPVQHAKPCPNGEAANGPCVWDARHMGDGQGRSFRLTKDDKVIYITHRRAHRLLGLPEAW